VQIARLKNLRNVSFKLRRFPLDSVSFLILLLMSYGVVWITDVWQLGYTSAMEDYQFANSKICVWIVSSWETQDRGGEIEDRANAL
jgi:hypothetical protein